MTDDVVLSVRDRILDLLNSIALQSFDLLVSTHTIHDSCNSLARDVTAQIAPKNLNSTAPRRITGPLRALYYVVLVPYFVATTDIEVIENHNRAMP